MLRNTSPECMIAYHQGADDFVQYLIKDANLSDNAKFEVLRAWINQNQFTRRIVPTNPATRMS